MNFGDCSHKTVEMPDFFGSLGPKRAPLPSRNRVKDWAKFKKLQIKTNPMGELEPGVLTIAGHQSSNLDYSAILLICSGLLD